MTAINKILKMAEDNHGMVTTAMIDAANISRGCLKYLADRGKLENTNRGVYVLPEIWEDEMYSLQSRFRRGIYSGETALFLLDLTDRTPINYCMTFPASYNVSAPKREGIICRQVKEPFYSLGLTQVQTPGKHSVKCYNMEKTLCDILQTRANTDIQIISEAFKRYIMHGNKNIPLLSEYAKHMRVEKRVRSYLEVLL